MTASRITVSKSKRGTTVKATGAAAQALFDAMTATPEAPPVGTVYSTVRFEDHGQDFLEWDIEEASGRVFACRPSQAWLWTGKHVYLKGAEPGGKLRLVGEGKRVKHPIESIVSGRVL